MAQASVQPTWALIQRPGGYPTGPSVGKLEMIWNTNEHSLYHRLSPYSNYNQGLIAWGDEPYYYIYPDQNTNFPNSLKKYDSHLFAPGAGVIDVIRTTKFLVSGRGIGFLATQFLLQTASPYNERRIYNPTSPIVAAGSAVTLRSVRPERSFDTSAGLAGIATTLLGGLGSAIFGPPKTNPVDGTTLVNNTLALPTATLTIGTKGLLRAGDALRAQSHLEAAWQGSKTTGFSILGLVTSLFQNFIPQTQTAQYRSDEKAYGLMIGAGAAPFKYNSFRGGTMEFSQLFIGGGPITRPDGDYPANAARLFVNPPTNRHEFNGTANIIIVNKLSSAGIIPTVGRVGYSVDESTDANSPGYKYGDNLGAAIEDNFQGSDVMIQYGMYVSEVNKYLTKDPEAQRANDTKTKLTAVMDKIKAASGKTYQVSPDQNSVLLMQDSVQYNYDRLFKTRNKNDPHSNYLYGSLATYRNSGVTMVSDELNSSDYSVGLPTAGKRDTINMLNVLDGSEIIDPLAGAWEPYKDDLIALYFYDVVNDKYIPFRAAMQGISEGGNASWEEMPFIGRADKVYSYGGFNRNLSFNLKIVISSIAELAPTWQRINYMMTSYKPANYTKASAGVVASGNSAYDRFMVPPMFMLTMGDMYRDQPILIQSVTMTIPDDATWETYNEDNVGAGNWSYMAGLITSPKVKFGQVPREVELGFTAVLLEKERAVVGGANFGHAPRNEEFSGWNEDTVPNGSAPNDWSKNLVADIPSIPVPS